MLTLTQHHHKLGSLDKARSTKLIYWLSFSLLFFLNTSSPTLKAQNNEPPNLKLVSSAETSKNTVTMTLHQIGERYFLYTGGSAKSIDVFSVSHQGELTHLKSFPIWKKKGPVRGLVTSTIAGTDYLFVGNKFGNAIEVHSIDSDGMLERVFVQEDTPEMHLGTIITLQVVHMNGISYLYAGGLEDTPGLTSFRIHDNGKLEHVMSLADNETIFTDGIIGMSIHTIDNQKYLFTGGFQDSGLSSFRLSPDGKFQNVSNVGDDHQLFLNGTYPVISSQLGEQRFVITGHRHHIYYNNTDFIKRKNFYYHGDGITVFQINQKGELITRSVMQGDTTTLIKGQTRLDSLPVSDDRALIAAATRDDESIQLAYLDKTGRLTAASSHRVGFPIYYAMDMAQIQGQSFLFAAAVKSKKIVSYKIEHP